MKSLSNHIILVISSILIISCSYENAIPETVLAQKPESLSSYLQVSFNDSLFIFSDTIENQSVAQTYFVPAGDSGDKILGATIHDDSSLVSFDLGYVQQSLSREELILKLIEAEQELAYGDYDGGYLKMSNNGFAVLIDERYSYLSGGSAYHTYKVAQPEGTYFRIGHYYAGSSQNTIWLEGSFKLELDRKYQGTEIIGEFLLEFPLCCFDDQ